jgi:hypothetical protein
VAKRYRAHLRDARRGEKSHKATWLRTLFARGLAPSIQILETGVPFLAWQETEQWYIRASRMTGFSLTNICDGGEGSLGFIPSLETRMKLSEAHKGRKCAPFSAEHRAKIGATSKGRKHSAEARARISAAVSGENHPNFGKHPSEETRVKMSLSKSGEKHSNFGKRRSPETRSKISASKKGHLVSVETRAKISAALRRWNNFSKQLA